MLGYTGTILVPGSAGEGPGVGFTGVSMTLESAVVDLGLGSVWAELDPGSTGANQAPEPLGQAQHLGACVPGWHWDGPGSWFYGSWPGGWAHGDQLET